MRFGKKNKNMKTFFAFVLSTKLFRRDEKWWQ